MAKTSEASSMQDMAKFSQASFDGAFGVWGDWGKSFQAIAAEMGDYSKRSFDHSAQTMQSLLTAKSLNQAVEIQANFAKRSCDEYMRQMSRIGSMYADLAKDAAKPMERQAQR